MAIETKERKIGDAVYMVTQLPARRALRLKAKLMKLFGASVTQMLLTALEPEEKKRAEMNEVELEQYSKTSAIERYKIQDLRKTSVVRSVQLLAHGLDDKTFDELCMELVQGIRRNGIEMNGATVDLDFAGNLTEFFAVVLFMLEVNFGDFFLVAQSTGSQFQASQETGLETDTKKTYTFRSEKNL